MNYKEWMDKYKNADNIVGKEFWICDYRLNSDKDNKPIRNVTPKLVKVFSNNDLPKNKRVYYSDVHFREVKNNKVLTTVIAPFDNTGYRGFTGVSLNIFDDEKECRKHFVSQCNEAICEYEEYIDKRKSEIDGRIWEIEQIIDDYK
jgi:hypothetical protein